MGGPWFSMRAHGGPRALMVIPDHGLATMFGKHNNQSMIMCCAHVSRDLYANTYKQHEAS
jgi:hypothetical protein